MLSSILFVDFQVSSSVTLISSAMRKDVATSCVVMHACDLGTSGGQRQQDCEFKASPDYKVRPFLNSLLRNVVALIWFISIATFTSIFQGL